MTYQNSLPTPPLADKDHSAIEVLRVWAAHGSGQEVSLRPTWEDPAAWGLLLVDVARHAANAYAREGHDPNVVLQRIRTMWEAEWRNPTDTNNAEDVTDKT